MRASLACGFSFVHIASHFVFLPARDLDSWLLLGDGTSLTAEQFLASAPSFDTIDLLVLSACETAMTSGSTDQGREVESLPAMLRAKGVKAVLASLWQVDDLSTAVLMHRFYRYWHVDKLPAREALRQAQLSLIAEHDKTATQARSIELADDDDAPRPILPPSSTSCLSIPINGRPFF